MQPSLLIESHNGPAAEPAAPLTEAAPEWTTFGAQRRRTLLFLILAALYVGYHLIARWVEYPLFRADWFYFGGEDPMRVKVGEEWHFLPPWNWPWYKPAFAYRWFLTLLPLAAWAGVVFFVLTRVRFLTHRRVAFVIVFLGLAFFEGNMRWYQMSKKHVSWNEFLMVFDPNASADLGLSAALYEEVAWQFAYHFLFLTACAFLAGPELRNCIQAIWNGPLGRTYFGLAGSWCGRSIARLRLETAWLRVLGWLDSKAVFACIGTLVLIDPVIIWAIDQDKQDNQAERTVLRQIADTNPLRMHSLDRAWDRVVFLYSPESQEIAAANAAMRDLESLEISTKGQTYSIPKRNVPARPENILILQSESWSAEIFEQTDMPFLNEFKKKCLRLKRHFSAANATHYGVMGLMHGSPVTFFTGHRKYYRHDPYMTHFHNHDFKTRLITRSVLSHHYLGHYVYPWTEPVSEPPGDFKVIPEIHEELAKPGPRLVYSFYHATHYPYDHDKEPRFMKYLPEVEYDFNYNRSGLFEWKEQIVNRYKNTLLNMDEWYRQMLEKVDLDKTIVVITGDHGEEFFQQGRLGHCSALNIHQTMTPCLVYIPGVEPRDVTFVTSHADIMPTIADALGHAKKPETLGQSLFEPVAFRYAVLSHFEFKKCMLWAVATEDRMAVFERDYRDDVSIVSLTDWSGRHKAYSDDPEAWHDRFRIIRRVEAELHATREELRRLEE